MDALHEWGYFFSWVHWNTFFIDALRVWLRVCLLPWEWTCFHSFLFFKLQPSASWGDNIESSLSWPFFSGGCSCFCLRGGRTWFHQSLFFLDSLLLLNISTSVALSPGWSDHPLGHNSHSCSHPCHSLLLKGYGPRRPGWLHNLVWALSGLPSILVDITAKILRGWWSPGLMARHGRAAGRWRLALLWHLWDRTNGSRGAEIGFWAE